MTEQEKAKKKPRPCTALRFDGAPLREHLVIVHFLSLSNLQQPTPPCLSSLCTPHGCSLLGHNSQQQRLFNRPPPRRLYNQPRAGCCCTTRYCPIITIIERISLSLRATTTDAIAPIIITPSDLVFSNPPLKQNRRPCDFRPSSTFLSDLYVRHFPFGLSTRPAL